MLLSSKVFLMQAEVQYVTWGSLNINLAGYFWNKVDFTVTKDGATATGNDTVNASTGETPAQIAAKLSKATSQLSYNWWNGKSLIANFGQIPQIIVNEHLLTRAEASVVTGLNFDETISHPGAYFVSAIVNDNNTVSEATFNMNVVNDGLTAQQVANRISGGTYYLKGTMQGQYGDSTAVTQDLHNYLTGDSQLFHPSLIATDVKWYYFSPC